MRRRILWFARPLAAGAIAAGGAAGILVMAAMARGHLRAVALLARTGFFVAVPIGILGLAFLRLATRWESPVGDGSGAGTRTAVCAAFAVSGLFLLAWPAFFVGPAFPFDPHSGVRAWIDTWVVRTYPLLWGAMFLLACRGFERRSGGRYLAVVSGLPFVPALLLACRSA
jgi:hypothetical protein